MVDRPALAEAEAVLEQPYDTSSAEQVNAARKKDGRKRRERLEVVAGLMDLKQGRAWVYEKLTSAHVFEPSFAHDPYATAFREGERNQGLMLLSDVMAAAPEQYVTMVTENGKRV